MRIENWGRASPRAVDAALRGSQERQLHGERAGEEFIIIYEPFEAFSYRAEEPDFRFIHEETEEEFWEYVDSAPDRLIAMRRGGGMMWHGMGQVCLEPLLNLKKRRINVIDQYMPLLQVAGMRTLRAFGVDARKNRYCMGACGLWAREKKIGFVGAYSDFRSGTVIHGLAINVSPDLRPFSLIDPCNLRGVRATSVEKIAGIAPPTAEFSRVLIENFLILLEQATKK